MTHVVTTRGRPPVPFSRWEGVRLRDADSDRLDPAAPTGAAFLPDMFDALIRALVRPTESLALSG